MISFLISFLIFIVVVAIVVIGIRWLLSLTGVAIPQPIMIILGLILFLILLVCFLNYMPIGASGPLFHFGR